MSSPLNTTLFNRSPAPSPSFLTPSSTPPRSSFFPNAFSEARFAQLLSRCDEMPQGAENGVDERRMSMGDALHTTNPHRPRFLSALTLSRPGFPFTPSAPSTTQTDPKEPTTLIRASSTPSLAKHVDLSVDPVDRTSPDKTVGFNGFRLASDKRHFDPSKEPRLLGIL